MGKYMVTVEINGQFDCEIKADSLEDAIEKGKKIQPQEVLRLKNYKRDAIQYWETGKITSVFEA